MSRSAPHIHAPSTDASHGIRGLRILVLLVLLLLSFGAAGADEEDAGLRLSRARVKEFDEREYARALEMYRTLVAEPGLDTTIRGSALLGMGRCHRGLDDVERAEAVWQQILDDDSLPADVHEKAEKALNEIKASRPEIDPALAQEKAQLRLDKERRARAAELMEQARRARDEGRCELARQLCLDALSWDPRNTETAALLTEIEEAMPDRAELLRTLLRFANTTSIQEFHRLKSRFEQLEKEGRDFYKAEDYTHADDAFRKAIQLVDRSEFFADLQGERAHAIQWMRTTIEKAAGKGLTLGPVPTLPDPGALAPSFQRRFYDLLSEVFTARPDEEDPLALYDAMPIPFPPGTVKKGLASGSFPKGISTTRKDCAMTRAEWAERWIRANLGTGWSDPTTASLRTGPLRILDRFGDILIVQHGRAIHAKVQELLDGFPTRPAPMAVDVAVIAATTAGGTALAERLGVKATPRESGEDLFVSNRLLEECVRDVEHLDGVQVVGTARLTLGRRTSATLEITQRTEDHPVFSGLPSPRLALTADESRYGLRLGIYTEDLMRAPGARRAAFGVRATTWFPTGTVVVPKSHAGGDWMRLPRPMAEQVVRSDRVIRHAGTLVLQGLVNPFPQSAATHPGLVLLFGVRETSANGLHTTVPDPPRATASSNGEGGTEEREYDLGPLATEVVDRVLETGWPQRPASIPVPLATRRKAREAFLATNLGSTWSGLVAPGEPGPVVVRGRVATAQLTPGRHAMLEQAIDTFRKQETSLFQVDVLSSQTTEQGLAEWLQEGRAQAFTPGTYLVTDAAGLDAMERRLRPSPTDGGRYHLQAHLLARATQRVAAQDLRALTIVEDIRFWRHTDGHTQRQIPVLGTAEEGIVVLVRPVQETADGKRLVIVDARAARLKALESLQLPDVELPAAKITVPRHYPTQRRQAAAPLGDHEAIVITLPAPEGDGRIIVVMVHVQKVQ